MPISKNQRAGRRVDAECRNKIRAARTTAEQIAILKTRPGESRREVNRLLAKAPNASASTAEKSPARPGKPAPMTPDEKIMRQIDHAQRAVQAKR